MLNIQLGMLLFVVVRESDQTVGMLLFVVVRESDQTVVFR